MDEEKKHYTIDDLIEICTEALANYKPGCAEYCAALSALEKLQDMKRRNNEKQISRFERFVNKIDPNTVLSGAITITVVLLVLNYENIRDGIIKSKAFAFIGKRLL